MDEERLRAAVEASWGEDTAFMSEHFTWSAANPACGQCCVTAMVVQDYLGGEVKRCRVFPGGLTHYINVLPDGRRLDWTAAQFEHTGVVRLREEGVLNRRTTGRYGPVRVRYERLAARVREALEVAPPAVLGRASQ